MREEPFFSSVGIFENIPGRPFNHAPTLVELPNRDLLVAWYGGSYEGADDVAILCSRFGHAENSWTQPCVLADTSGRCDGNPVLFVDRYGHVWLFYVTMEGDWWDSCVIKYAKSGDAGLTWGSPKVMRRQWGWMTRNKPLILTSGDILLPIYDEEGWHSMVIISEDDGETWTRHGDISTSQGVIQPTVVQRRDGSLLMYMRTGGKGGYIWESKSNDDGRTWTPASKTHLRNPNSSIEMVRASNGSIILAFNDTSVRRTPLNVALSTDEGYRWAFKKCLETGVGEFSYPSVTQSKDDKIHIVYTHRIGGTRRGHPRYHAYGANTKHVALNEAWIKS